MATPPRLLLVKWKSESRILNKNLQIIEMKCLRDFKVLILYPFVFLFLSGCMQLSDSRPAGPLYEAYQPILDVESRAFVFQALEEAILAFGEPPFPVNTIHLRRSRKTEAAQRYSLGENFSLTQCVDPTNGVFVIFVGVGPDHRNYYALLGHECAHLIDPRITDWYMEGIATVFSEQVCAAQGKKWGDWRRRFGRRSRKEPYALSYRMMQELQVMFPDEYSLLVQHTVPRAEFPELRRIDIDGWIETLSEEQQVVAVAIIQPYIKKLRKKVSAQYDFQEPQAIKSLE